MTCRASILLLMLLAAPVAAEDTPPADAQMMREAWTSTAARTMGVVQPVYNRVISFDLPRPFVPASRQLDQGFYMVEYLPDGQNFGNWTQMITLTAFAHMGEAKADDDAIADVMFNRLTCPGALYRDLGSVKSSTSVRQRAIVIGCDAIAANEYSGAAKGAGERTAIAFLRDDETVWTIQFAERSLPGSPTKLFDPATAATKLEQLGILACAVSDASHECDEARMMAKAVQAQPAK